ncbi:MAG: efflux transporter outer membrane subunit [Methylophilaceae bacterium]
MRKVAVITLLVQLSACSLIPEYLRPQAPVATEFPSYGNSNPANTGTVTDSIAADISWQTLFADARLQKLITLALEKNRDLRIAALDIEAARAQYRIQQAARLPTINATADATRARSANIFGTGTGVLPPYTIYSVGLGFTAYELDFFGRIGSLKEQALQQFIATQEARTSAQISLVAEVANAYLNERALDERLAIAKQTQTSQQASYELARKIFDVGNSSALDLRIAETQLETANANIAGLKRQRAQAENALALLIGSPLPADLPAPQALNSQLTVSELQPGLPSELLTRRPDIRQAENLLKAANANIGAARAAFFPTIKLTTTVGTASRELDGLFKSDSTIWNFSPQLVLPIFDAGRNKANLTLAEIQKDINIARYEKAIQTAFSEVADALATSTLINKQIAAQQRLVDAEQARFQLAELRYRNGLDSNLNLLDAQRSLYTTQQALVELRLSRMSSLVTLYKALGGGWN